MVKRDGAVFVSVPDAHTFTDRLYLKVARDRGGHVNLFGSSAELETMLSWYFGLPHVATRMLHSGLTFLNRTNVRRSPHIRAQMRFGGFPEWALALINLGLRAADGRFQTRLSVYRWGMYFGSVGEAVDCHELINVCLRCGDGLRLSEVRRGIAGPGIHVSGVRCEESQRRGTDGIMGMSP